MSKDKATCCEEVGAIWADWVADLLEEEQMADKTVAARMAGITISDNEDEVNQAQQTAHEARSIEYKRKEERKLLLAELRRIKFALKELDKHADKKNKKNRGE